MAQQQPFALIEQANDTWCLDFKGWFRTHDGRRCDPLIRVVRRYEAGFSKCPPNWKRIAERSLFW